MKQQQERILNDTLTTDPKHNSNKYLYLSANPVISPVSNGRYLGDFFTSENIYISITNHISEL